MLTLNVWHYFQIDVLEDKLITNVIVLQTVLQEVNFHCILFIWILFEYSEFGFIDIFWLANC